MACFSKSVLNRKAAGAWNLVEGKHDICTIHLTEEEVEQSEAWINELQELYSEAAAMQERLGLQIPLDFAHGL